MQYNCPKNLFQNTKNRKHRCCNLNSYLHFVIFIFDVYYRGIFKTNCFFNIFNSKIRLSGVFRYKHLSNAGLKRGYKSGCLKCLHVPKAPAQSLNLPRFLSNALQNCGEKRAGLRVWAD